MSDAQTWASSGSPEGILAGKLLQWMLDTWSVKSAYIWDLVTAINAAERLTLRAITIDDRFAIFENYSDPGVANWFC